MTVKDKHGYNYLTHKYSQFNELALACNMNSAQIAEDLAVQGILKVDPSTVRRWRRNEHPVPPIVRRRMEKIAEWVYNLSQSSMRSSPCRPRQDGSGMRSVTSAW